MGANVGVLLLYWCVNGSFSYEDSVFVKCELTVLWFFIVDSFRRKQPLCTVHVWSEILLGASIVSTGCYYLTSLKEGCLFVTILKTAGVFCALATSMAWDCQRRISSSVSLSYNPVVNSGGIVSAACCLTTAQWMTSNSNAISRGIHRATFTAVSARL